MLSIEKIHLVHLSLIYFALIYLKAQRQMRDILQVVSSFGV